MKSLIGLHWVGRFFAVVLLIGASQCVTAQSGKIIEFDAPGATETIPSGINSANSTAGYYTDSQYVYHGFIRDTSGNLTSFDEPDAAQGAYLGTLPLAINDAGEVAGYYTPLSNPSSYQGFIRDAAGNFTSFGVTGMLTEMVFAFNDAGQTAGCATQAEYCPGSGGESEGAIRNLSGATVTFLPANAVSVFPESINSGGAVTGSYSDSKGDIHGFVRSASGTITEFDMPDYKGPGVGTWPTSINDSNEIVGRYYDATGRYRGFIRSPQGKLSRFDVPGTDIYTLPWAVNSAGTIIGAYFGGGSANYYQAFLRDAAGHVTSFSAPRAGTQPGQGTAVAGINQLGVIAGYYIDSGNVFHAYLRLP
jgi:hypothetical protein